MAFVYTVKRYPRGFAMCDSATTASIRLVGLLDKTDREVVSLEGLKKVISNLKVGVPRDILGVGVEKFTLHTEKEV